MIIKLNLGAGANVLHLRTELRAEAGADNEPRWNKLFPIGVVRYRGDFPTADGGIRFDRAFLQRMVDNWVRAGRPHQHVNYDHEFGIAAGWIEDLELRDDGLWALIRWTSKARGHILADEYRFLSPEFSVDGLDKATGGSQGPTLHGCALLNDPYLEELPRVAAANTPTAAKAAGATKMDKAKLIAILGLAATATDDEVYAALEARKKEAVEALASLKEKETLLADAVKQVTEFKAKAETVDLSNNAATKLAADLKAANDKVVELSKTVAEMQTKEKDAAIETYLTELVKAGKLTPAMREGVKAHALAMGLDAVKKLWDNAPVAVDLKERGIGGEGTESTPEGAHKKLRAIADDLAKEHKLSRSDAMIRAMEKNPELARQSRVAKS